MEKTKTSYQSPLAGTPLLHTISCGCRTPILSIKYSNLLKPFYYPNSPKPRYSVTCVVDPEIDADFLKNLQTIEKNEGVGTMVKAETKKNDKGQAVSSGKFIVKFQSKDKIPVYTISEENNPIQIELEDELAPGEKVCVLYDILRYTKRGANLSEHGLSFRPSCIYLYRETEKKSKTE